MGMLIQNDRVHLRRTEREDLPFVLEAERDPENAKYVGLWSFGQHESALDNLDVLHLIASDAEGRRVGYAILRGLESPNDSIELMRIVATQKGFGYGKQVIALIKRWCFGIRGAHRLWLDVREHNVRAMRVYESQGFVREGLLRECVKVGDGYQSLIVMAIVRGDPAAFSD